ncbi:MAG: GAF domain-containing protein [Bacillota bacterium]|nr:GAF domain-containing protein [Bacillota bacterium]
MDRKYTDCSTEELYRFYLEDFFELPDNGRSFTDELKQEAKYEEDFKFRTAVDFLSLVSHAVITPMDKLLSDTMDMLERTTALEQWQFVAHCWNIIATLYSQVRMYERAVECFTRATLIESRHGLSSITLVAYFNMSIIFYEMELYKRALEYSKKSNEILKDHHQSNKRFKLKLFNNYCISLQIISSMEAGEAEQEEADKIYEELRSFDLTGFPNYQICHYYTTLFLYQLVLYGKGKCAFEECRTLFLKAGEYVNRGREFEIAPYYFVYVYSCMKRKVDPKLFEEEIRLLEQVLPTSQPKINMECIELIIDYYKLTGNVSKVEEWKDLYIEALRATVADQKEQQKNSVELVETLLLDAGISNEVGSQNSELKILYREALKIKGQLQEAYHRIESINKIGRQLTATSNLNEVITEFHEVLKEHFEVDSFALLVADFEKNQLRTQIFSYNGALQPEATIDFDDPDSLSAKCFRTNKIICLERKNDAIVKRLKMKESIPMHSAVYLPLSVEDRVIGVYTIQHRDYDVYKQDLEFLEALAPFFSIALNNALRSWGLEKEIHSHIITQNQLEIANKNLVRISFLDAISRIASSV